MSGLIPRASVTYFGHLKRTADFEAFREVFIGFNILPGQCSAQVPHFTPNRNQEAEECRMPFLAR